MVITCWSVKGGSGTTTVAAALACVASAAGEAVTVVDLGGDVPTALGRAEPVAGAGVSEVLLGGAEPLDGALRLATAPPEQGIAVLRRGRAPWPDDGTAGERLAAALARLPGLVVVDAGTLGPPPRAVSPAAAVVAGSSQSWLVLRPCYLALRRAQAIDLRPSGIVLVEEGGRALGRRDVEHALGVPVTIRVPCEQAVARAVDAGVLATRMPGALLHALRGAA